MLSHSQSAHTGEESFSNLSPAPTNQNLNAHSYNSSSTMNPNSAPIQEPSPNPRREDNRGVISIETAPLNRPHGRRDNDDPAPGAAPAAAPGQNDRQLTEQLLEDFIESDLAPIRQFFDQILESVRSLLEDIILSLSSKNLFLLDMLLPAEQTNSSSVFMMKFGKNYSTLEINSIVSK